MIPKRFDFTLLYGFPPPYQFTLRFRVIAVSSMILVHPQLGTPLTFYGNNIIVLA